MHNPVKQITNTNSVNKSEVKSNRTSFLCGNRIGNIRQFYLYGTAAHF